MFGLAMSFLKGLICVKMLLIVLNLPICIKQDRIGKLTLHMPFNQLSSKPVSAEIEDFFLILGPQLGHNFYADFAIIFRSPFSGCTFDTKIVLHRLAGVFA